MIEPQGAMDLGFTIRANRQPTIEFCLESLLDALKIAGLVESPEPFKMLHFPDLEIWKYRLFVMGISCRRCSRFRFRENTSLSQRQIGFPAVQLCLSRNQ